MRAQISRTKKWLVLALAAILALGAFGYRFAGYFRQGATSVAARFDYWRAAIQIAVSSPTTGTGPGTFQIPYAKIKSPDAEMARLAHNDFLQQGSDSGILGFLTYVGVFVATIPTLYRKTKDSQLAFAIWLGLAAWAIHSTVEFGLYIPAVAWSAFTLMGWLHGIDVDTIGKRN
jgi:O-antigen ligase